MKLVWAWRAECGSRGNLELCSRTSSAQRAMGPFWCPISGRQPCCHLTQPPLQVLEVASLAQVGNPVGGLRKPCPVSRPWDSPMHQ